MSFSKLSFGASAILAFAQLSSAYSLPPLIPKIPGVTELLNKAAFPLPILQIPTPALPAPAYTPSNIRPKKIGYYWTASGDNQHADFLVSYSLDDDTFGTLLRIAEVPTSGNSPHHSGPSADGKTIWGGGLLSLLKTQDTGFFFDVSDPYEPVFKKSNRGLFSSIADEVRALPNGGFLITYMGSAVGTSPGRLVEVDANYDIVHEYPEDVPGLLNVLGEQFSPHGLSIDFEANLILTSDFVVPATVLKPFPVILHANTLRLWDYHSKTIINTITIPNGGGIQDVKFIPGNKDHVAIATAVHTGEVWAIYPFENDENGKPGKAKLLYSLGERFQDNVAIYSDITQDGRFAYFTCTTSNHIAQLDISDLHNVKRLDDPNEQQPIVGPHYVKVSPDQKNLAVTDYFVETGQIGNLNTVGDYKGLWIDINHDGSLSFNRSINFSQQFGQGGPGGYRNGAKVSSQTFPYSQRHHADHFIAPLRRHLRLDRREEPQVLLNARSQLGSFTKSLY
jgi:selenium-binding protein 1